LKAINNPTTNMNRLALVFILFAMTVFFGLSVTVVQIVTDSFYFPFDSAGSFDSGESYDSEDLFGSEEYIETESESDYEMSESEAEAILDAADLSEFTWTCGDGTVIDGAWTNDGECDCNDCTDESVYVCPSGQLIAKAYVNDGECDCEDSCDDEA
jgi:hypothetical protein